MDDQHRELLTKTGRALRKAEAAIDSGEAREAVMARLDNDMRELGWPAPDAEEMGRAQNLVVHAVEVDPEIAKSFTRMNRWSFVALPHRIRWERLALLRAAYDLAAIHHGRYDANVEGVYEFYGVPCVGVSAVAGEEVLAWLLCYEPENLKEALAWVR